MAEVKGYTCDAGCGASVVLKRAADLVTRDGWFITHTPDGFPTWHTCSLPCLIKVAERASPKHPAIGPTG